MSDARQLLRDYLEQQSAHGVTHVALTEDARNALFSAPKPPQKQEVASHSPVPVRKAEPLPVTSHSVVDHSPLTTAEKKVQLDRLAVQAEDSREIRELGTLRDIMVFATGNPDAEILFVGEAPGAEEEKQREPFVGPAGQLLTKIIQAMGLRRSDVYISNICKFRPMIEDGKMQGSKNRPPSLGEMLACLPFVTGEINIIQPKVIVALGSTAAAGLGIEGTVGRLRGKFSEFRTIPVMVTYHPSYLLRREKEDGGGNAEKRLVWEDMMQVMHHVGLPISEKQRAYFSKVR